MKKIRNFFQLLLLKFVVTLKNTIEYFKVVLRYYRNSRFRKIDFYLLRFYIQQNPYLISKKFLQEKGEKDVYNYGETPLTTLEKISHECKIKSDDIVYELGSGRGRSCFWLHCFIGCKVVGVEFVPDFVAIAQRVKKIYNIKGVSFVYRDILKAYISDATVVYFYGTSSETAFILALIEKLKKLAPGTKIITVSFPLTTYSTEPLFELIKSFPVAFTWGDAEVFLQIRK